MPDGVAIVPRVRRGNHHTPREDFRTTITVLRSFGTTEETIARLLRIDLRTLRKHYKEELARGKETIVAAIGSVVVNAALDGNVTAALAYLTRLGGEEWRKVEGRLHGGMPGAPPIEHAVKARVVVLPDNHRPSLSEDEIRTEREIVAKESMAG